MTGKLLTPAEAAERLGCSKKTLLEHVSAGDIQYVNIGRGPKRPRRRFSEEALAEFIAQRTRRETPLALTNAAARGARPWRTPVADFRPMADFDVIRAAEEVEQRNKMAAREAEKRAAAEKRAKEKALSNARKPSAKQHSEND